jgi:uncharacterized protein (TIGR00251 family)
MARFTIRVQPGASANRIIGEEAGAWRIRVTAPPVDGKANEAVVRLLADCLGVRRGALAIERGHSDRTKVIAVEDLTAEEIASRLRACVGRGR